MVDPRIEKLADVLVNYSIEGIVHFTRHMLFDEKMAGSFHMALGRSYPETGGKNVSAIHWDMLCDMRNGGKIWVDDELLYKDGEFVVEF